MTLIQETGKNYITLCSNKDPTSFTLALQKMEVNKKNVTFYDNMAFKRFHDKRK